ncbi:MAG: putative toxin-antitoxin system toxin component, PIN family [Hylemonella sp.]|nr:putative toxin-antitoxin system toxin component, PIN family [Hylemonella sp.]
MKLILDTNTVLSALFKPQNRQAELLRLWRMHQFEWLVCTQQLEEIANVLSRPRIFTRIAGGSTGAQGLVEEMHAHCTFHPLSPPFPSLCRDAKDDYLVALLLQARASYLITGDNDLLALKNQLPIATVPDFLDRL